MNVLAFDTQLARNLAEVKRSIAALNSGLQQSGHGCACDQEGLCAHHAHVASELSEAIKSIDLAISIANERE